MGTTSNAIKVLCLAALLASAETTAAQSCRDATLRRWGVGAGTAAATAVTVALSADSWWPEPVDGFRFQWGESPSREQDRLLHAMVGRLASLGSRELWSWACLDDRAATWAGALTAIAVSLPKEIGDGLRPGRGFSTPDFAATAAGALLPVLHEYWEPSQIIQFKGYYYPSDEYRARLPGAGPSIATDYAGQRYFLAFFPGRLAPTPRLDWLGLALGHSATTWISQPPIAQYYLVPDVDLGRLPWTRNLPRSIRSLLSVIHLPLPGLRLSSGDLTAGVY